MHSRPAAYCLFAVLLLSSTALSSGQGIGEAAIATSSDEDQLRDLELARFRAMAENDFSVLDSLLSDDLTYTHTTGQTETKAEFIERLQSGEIRYLEIEPDEISVRVYGDVAILTGRSKMKVESQGRQMTLKIVFLDVWVRVNDAWQMVAWQSTRLPENDLASWS